MGKSDLVFSGNPNVDINAGLGVVAYAGNVVFTNATGKGLFQFRPSDAERLARTIFNEAAKAQGKPLPFPEENEKKILTL